MLNIPKYMHYDGESKIALMDNSSIAFMEQLERNGYSAKVLLRGYDVIIIPNWVLEEVKDSIFRSNYIESLRNDGFPIYSIAEESYADLVDGEEGRLYRIVLATVSSLGVLKSYLHRYVEKPDPLDMSAYSDWITEMYQNWPMSEKIIQESGREKKEKCRRNFIDYFSRSDFLVLSWN